MESLSLGCVTSTGRWVKKPAKPSKKELEKVYLAACTEIEGIRQGLSAFGLADCLWNIRDCQSDC